MSQPVVFTPVGVPSVAAPAPAHAAAPVPARLESANRNTSARLTPLVTALKANDLVAAAPLLADSSLTGADLVNVAQSVAKNSAAAHAVMADPRIGAPEVSALINAATRSGNDDLLAVIIQDPKVSLLKNTSTLNRAFANRPYDLMKIMTAPK